MTRTQDGRRVPPSGWLITRAAVRVLAALTPEARAEMLANPLTSRNWHRFRDTLHRLDRQHGSRAAWLYAPDANPPGDASP